MTATVPVADDARPLASRIDGGAFAAWTLGFATVAYLALKGGGYDIVVRSQVGIGVWWIVLFGAALGILPQRRSGRAGLAVIVLLAAFTGWSALSTLWSASPERALGETARDVTLLGIALLAGATVHGGRARWLVYGVFAAIALVGVLACLSQLHPAWFGEPETADFLGSGTRLSYGLNYWNALAALLAMGLPLGLAIASSARSAALRATTLAVLPVLALAGFFTLSRGGILAALIGLLVALALSPERGRWLAKLALATAGAAVLIVAALDRDELRAGLRTAAARDQGDELLLITVLVVVGIVVVHAGLSVARARRPAAIRKPLRSWQRRAAWATVLVALLVGATAFVASGSMNDRWQEFKAPDTGTAGLGVQRLGSASGTGRYEIWLSAIDAFETAPVAGIGAGGFEGWWANHATRRESVLNAHSLYAETLAELGLIGILLIGGLIVLVLATGARVARQPNGRRAICAGATAACAAFAVAAGVDWLWQVTVLPVCFLLLAAALLAPDEAPSRRRRQTRPLFVAFGIVALVALAVPLAATTYVRSSQAAAVSGRLATALQHAGTAARLQPYAASPLLQRALVLEQRGDLVGAVGAARAAERKDATDWRGPLLLARLQASRGHTGAAVAAFRRAQSLNKAAVFLR